MVREELKAASGALREAAELTDDETVEERVYNQSLELAELATADRGPDHGRLDRHRNILLDIRDGADSEVAVLVDEAMDHLRSYREGVEGV
jgi:hypothetical protein